VKGRALQWQSATEPTPNCPFSPHVFRFCCTTSCRQVWETSQHPLIVNASTVVDTVLAESEQGRAMRTIHALDPGFDM
jgi:hypothetical protein